MANETKEQQVGAEKEPRLSITFGKGLVDFFRVPSKAEHGIEYARVKIPNQDPEDKRSWETFVVPSRMLHLNDSGKSYWVSLPENGQTQLSRSIVVGQSADGKNLYDREERKVSNTELKSMVEAYKEREAPRISITFGKGMATPFTSKDGKELTRISIPNPDPEDKRSWETFVLPSSMVRENESGKSVWVSLPENGETRLSRSVITGQDEKGKNIYDREERTIPNTELKSMLEAYKEKDQELGENVPSEQTHNTATVLLVSPGKYPETVEMNMDLVSLQKAVGGDIEAVSPFNEDVAIICNEEGKIQGLEMNRAIRDENGEVADVICGDFLVVGLDEDDFGSLSPELLTQFEDRFHYPEVFSESEKGIEAFRQVPEGVLNDAVKAEHLSDEPSL